MKRITSSPGVNSQADEIDANIVAKVKGELTIRNDQSMNFKPIHPGTGEPLYKEVLAKSKNGCVKLSEKSAVMTIVIDANSQDLPATLMNKAFELLRPLADANSSAIQLPDVVQCLGKTPHSVVYLHNDSAIIMSKIPFDEPNPKVADLVKQASPDQLKFIRTTLEPEAIFRAEFAAVCLLLADCKAQHERQEKVLNVKPRKKSKK